jgi:hypothetical protein
MRKKLKLRSEGDDFGSKSAHAAVTRPVVWPGGACVWRESGVWSQTVGFISLRLQESGFSHSEVVLAFNFFK